MRQRRNRAGGPGEPPFVQPSISRSQMMRALWGLAAAQVGREAPTSDAVTASLTPRLRETLDRLVLGLSEKEIAADLRLSYHTIHVYVTTLYRRFSVSSRAELLSKVHVQRGDVTMFHRAVRLARRPIANRPVGEERANYPQR